MKKIFKWILCVLFLFCLPFGLIAMALLSHLDISKRIIFANWDSYMSQTTQKYLIDHCNCDFSNTYSTNDELENKFANYYDIAIPSSYEVKSLYNKNCLAKINWKEFKLKKDDGSYIKNAEDAKVLFDEKIINQINNVFQDRVTNNLSNDKFNILDYAIPYFSQNLQFLYRSEKDEFKGKEFHNWAEILDAFNQTSSLCKDHNSLVLINDYETDINLATLIKEKNEGQPKLDKDKIFGQNNSFQDFHDTFQYLCNAITNNNQNKHFVSLIADSGKVVQSMVDKNSDKKYCLSYTGDILYSLLGGGETEPLDISKHHVLKPKHNICYCDFVVVNKKNENNWSKIKNVLSPLLFDHYNELFIDCKEKGVDQEKLWKTVPNEDEETIFDNLTVENFNGVMYTPMLKKIYEQLTKENQPVGFWDNYLQYKKDDKDEKIKQQKVYKQLLEYSEYNYFAPKLNAMQRCNGQLAWVEAREKL